MRVPPSHAPSPLSLTRVLSLSHSRRERHSKEDGERLGLWIHHQRSAQKNGKLGARRQSRLEGLGLSWEFVVAEGAWRLGHDELQRICGRFKAAAFGSSLEVFFQRHCRKGENTLQRDDLRAIFRRVLKIPAREFADSEVRRARRRGRRRLREGPRGSAARADGAPPLSCLLLLPRAQIDDFIDEVDRDGDRELSLDELVLFIERGGVDISDEGGPSPSARRSPRTSPRMGQRTSTTATTRRAPRSRASRFATCAASRRSRRPPRGSSSRPGSSSAT